MKRLQRHRLEGVEERLDRERQLFVQQIQTPEARQGLLAFLAAMNNKEALNAPF